MNFYPHLAVTTIITAPILYQAHKTGFLTQEEVIQCGIFAFMGSWFPDLDTNSKPSKWYARLMVPGVPFLVIKEFYLEAIAIVALFVFAKIGKHRGWTHSYWIPVLLLLVSLLPGLSGGFWLPYLLIPLALGILTHLIPENILR